MQNLYNALTSPIPEYKDNGIIEHRPPTAVMLRAGKMLQQLVGTNEVNMKLIHSLQLRESESLVEIETLRKELSDAKNNEKPSFSVPIADTFESLDPASAE